MGGSVHAGPIYTACFSGTALTTVSHDVFGILAPSDSRVMIHEVRIGEASDAVTEEQLVSVQFLRGSTASAEQATPITPRHLHGWAGTPTAGSSVFGPVAALASTASAVLIHADTWNVTQASYVFCPEDCERPILAVDQRLHVRLGAASTAMSISGTLKFSEIGKMPLS